MKVAELREKAKEFEIETTGKKKAELVEEIYTTAAKAEGFRDIKGILQIRPDSSGIIHAHGYMKSNEDAFVPAYLIRSARLRTGDVIEGSLRPSRGGDKRAGLAKITTVNGMDPEQIRNRPKFGDLTPVYPNEPLRMEHGKDSITGRAIDIVSPIGKGQRGLIVSPPKAGKTTILKKICQSISINNPEVHLICLLVDERPEEVTDMQRSIKGEVVASTFDMPADNHTRVAELVIERAKRIVELGGDVVVVLDSITRLARAYNLAAPASGRILSGGVDSAALYPPKRFLGAARNIENGGSLTILASALIDTGSKMDEVIFEEFKGTGNMELKLDRDLPGYRSRCLGHAQRGPAGRRTDAPVCLWPAPHPRRHEQHRARCCVVYQGPQGHQYQPGVPGTFGQKAQRLRADVLGRLLHATIAIVMPEGPGLDSGPFRIAAR